MSSIKSQSSPLLLALVVALCFVSATAQLQDMAASIDTVNQATDAVSGVRGMNTIRQAGMNGVGSIVDRANDLVSGVSSGPLSLIRQKRGISRTSFE